MTHAPATCTSTRGTPAPADLADLTERTVDTDEVARLMLAAHLARTGTPEPAPDRVRSTTWTPAGARKIRRRTFVQLDIDGVPVAVAKVPLSTTDPETWRWLHALLADTAARLDS